jgi:hypothetical protein
MTNQRTLPPRQNTPREAVIWVDHHRAVIIEARHGGRDHVEVLDRRATETGPGFEARTIDRLAERDLVIVSGPASARIDFERSYVAMTHRPDCLVDVAIDAYASRRGRVAA